MNPSPVPSPSAPPIEEPGLNLQDLLDSLLQGRWLILACSLLIGGAGALYASMASPIYEANLLVQVEDSRNATGNLLGQVSLLLEPKSSTPAEIEILRSRMVLNRALDGIALDIEAQPRRVPLLGPWAAQGSAGLSTPGLWGFAAWGDYVWGQENIQVGLLEVPAHWVGQRLLLTVQGNGRYTLQLPDGQQRAGRVGQPLEDGALRLLVQHIEGQPGAQFVLRRQSRLKLLEDLQLALRIAEKKSQSGIIGVSLEGGDPAATAHLLNQIGREYVRQNIERRAEETANTLRFLDAQLPSLKADLESAEARYNAFRATKGTVDLGEESRALLQQAIQVQSRLLDLQQKREELLVRYTPSHPQVQALDRQIREVQQQNQRINQDIRRLPVLEQDILRINRDVKVNAELYASMLNSAQQLKLTRAGKTGTVRLIDTAVPPEEPVKPKRLLIGLMALLLGLVAGVAAALARTWWRGGINDPAQIENRLGLHVFASLPHSARQQQLTRPRLGQARQALPHEVLADLDPHDPAIEGLRSLRTALQFAMLQARRPIILITGPTPALGKSFVAVNLASVIAAAGQRVLLIDADLRRGHLHQYLGQARSPGLSEYLSGHDTAPAIRPHPRQSGLHFLASGALPPNPADLLLQGPLEALLQSLTAHYDHIIIDSPPVLLVSDAAIIARHVGASFLLAREDHTQLAELDEAARRMARAGQPISGVIYNDLRPRLGAYGRYGRYGRYGTHGRYTSEDLAPKP